MPTPPDSSAAIRAQLPALLREVQAARRVAIGTHLNPDGDAVGSALAMAHALDQLGVEVEVLCRDPAPSYLRFLPGAERIRRDPKNREFDLAIALDLDAMDRLGPCRVHLEDAPRLVVIDHHIPHEAPGDLRIVDVPSPATSAILCDLFFDSEIEVTPAMAVCLLVGIITDTGSFRFPNTTPHCLHQAARLLELGADLPKAIEELYMSRPAPAARLTGAALTSMKLEMDGKIAWTLLRQETMDEFGAADEHTEGIVNEMLAIETVRIAAILREGQSGRFKGSLRSRGNIDVASVAKLFDGGGHRNAAGLTVDGPAEVATERLISALKACLASS